MTKERKLAIQMWQEIVDKCKAGDDFYLADYKADFCKKHDLDWHANCYLRTLPYAEELICFE